MSRLSHQAPKPQKSPITLQTVAAQAGVSVTTAAAVLRDAPGLRASSETRRRVLETSARLGYRRNALAASLRSGRTHTVGVVPVLAYPSAQRSLADLYGLHVADALFTAASRRGLRVLSPGGRAEDILDGRLDGVVFVGVHDRELTARVEEAGLPCVAMSSGTCRRVIETDNEMGVAAALAHLVGLGHRHIAHWAGAASNAYGSGRRRAAFETYAALQGLHPRETPVLDSADEVREMLRLAPPERPTAIVAFNDFQAFQALDLAREAGLDVPGDLSLVGYDDTLLADVARPTLTTVHNPFDAQAETALSVLQQIWDGDPDPPIPPSIPTHLVVRQSTAPLSRSTGGSR